MFAKCLKDKTQQKLFVTKIRKQQLRFFSFASSFYFIQVNQMNSTIIDEIVERKKKQNKNAHWTLTAQYLTVVHVIHIWFHIFMTIISVNFQLIKPKQKSLNSKKTKDIDVDVKVLMNIIITCQYYLMRLSINWHTFKIY